MRQQYIRIKGQEIPIGLLRFQEHDPRHDLRATVTFRMTGNYAEARELFTSPGAWSAVIRYTVVNEETEDAVNCTDYEILCSVHDHCNGVLTITMGKATAAELLAVLLDKEVVG